VTCDLPGGRGCIAAACNAASSHRHHMPALPTCDAMRGAACAATLATVRTRARQQLCSCY
jgi:hypothetical protein